MAELFTRVFVPLGTILRRRGRADPSTFVLGVTKPVASQVGPAAGGYDPTKRIINGNYTMATNEILENATINGWLLHAPGSKVRGCEITGDPAGAYVNGGGIVRHPSSAAGSVTEFCNIGTKVLSDPAMNAMRMEGPSLAYRNDIHGGTDAIKVANNSTDRVKIHANFLHAYAFRTDDPAQAANAQAPGHTHNDGIQANGNAASNWEAIGNFFDWTYDPAISNAAPTIIFGASITLSNTTRATNVLIDANWHQGGDVGFQSGATGGGQVLGDIVISNGRWAGNFRLGMAIRYNAANYGSMQGEFTNTYGEGLSGVPSSGKVAGQALAVGNGIKRD